MQRSKVSKAPAQSGPINPSAGNNQDLEKKLSFLKDLRDKDLIDDEEYDMKRKELLNSYL